LFCKAKNNGFQFKEKRYLIQSSNLAVQPNSKFMDLASIGSGQRVQLIKVVAGRNLNGRLLALGLIKGTEICIIINEGNGPLLIGLGMSRMTIGREMAEKIMVK
jgi:ferrous iron transport protein A